MSTVLDVVFAGTRTGKRVNPGLVGRREHKCFIMWEDIEHPVRFAFCRRRRRLRRFATLGWLKVMAAGGGTHPPSVP